MQKLIVRGDPGIRTDAIINYGGEEQVVFSCQRQGDWHGPDEPQLWCTIGTEAEREAFEKREYVPHWLDVDAIDAEALDVVKSKGDLAV
ncbi:HAH_0734 family protein [Halorarum halobium]|uniref:HAH_0734 family protein n=1 Tax=Halorarum halobium TaxID=3075121 RepID=UPI0028AB3332|nr:HAH_0734 family protein [Halobaculum sp. XH14]